MTDARESGRSWHDMGGTPGGALELAEHDFALWEKRVDALVILCGEKGLFTVDGLRNALEEMGPDAFERMTYYERWVEAVARNLVARGVTTIEELTERIEAVRVRGGTYGAASLGP